ncbi:unnamed protein product, partial [marine sediment metagenome]
MIRLNRKGFTLVEIMIVVAIIALLAAIAIPNLLRARMNANEAAAQSTLKSYATSCESYAAATSLYPTVGDESELTGANPPYFPIDMDARTKGGYTYAVVFAGGGYTITATSNGAQSGTWNYQITTGAVLGRDSQSAPTG